MTVLPRPAVNISVSGRVISPLGNLASYAGLQLVSVMGILPRTSSWNCLLLSKVKR